MTPPPAYQVRWTERGFVAFRLFLMTGVLVAGVGVAGRFLSWPLVTSTVGPTAYVFAVNPDTEAARLRNAVIGHGVAVGAGLAALAVFGLLHYPPVSSTGTESFAQVGAAATAAGVTVFVLELVGSHHAPAAATALLIATGLAKPGSPLIGLVLGLAVVIVLGPLVGRFPLARRQTISEKSPGSKEESRF